MTLGRLALIGVELAVEMVGQPLASLAAALAPPRHGIETHPA
jgi:hypothetical protein